MNFMLTIQFFSIHVEVQTGAEYPITGQHVSQ